MKRMWKLMRRTLWLGVIVALVVVGFKAAHPLMNQFEERANPFKQSAQQFVQPFQQQWDQQFAPPTMPPVAKPFDGRGGDKRMEHRQEMSMMNPHMMRGHHDHGFGFGKLVGSLLLLIVGLALWKRGGRAARLIGGLLILIALWPLLQIALMIAVPVTLLYLAWRYLRRGKRESEYLAFAPSDREYTTSHSIDLLDEWEANTRRQLKNKEEE